MAETVAEEIARLQSEIGQRQSRLHALVLGDPRISVQIGPLESSAPNHLLGGACARPLMLGGQHYIHPTNQGANNA